ncbi:MAG TPA: cobalamin-dependent protein, partial [Acidobacteriota bacterium]|nr:cobalamin-dependent protein [Acidobacteriota bacterium]
MTTAPPPHSPWGISGRLPPLGLSFVAASLEKADFKVQMLDNYHIRKPLEQIQEEVRRLKPEIVGITCGSVTYRPCIETAKAVKEALPSCKIVVGGWQPSYMPESLLEQREIDYLVRGEGEEAMVALASKILEGEDRQVIAKIPGVTFMDNGKMVMTPPKVIEDVDQIPFPARHLLQMEIYDRAAPYFDAKPM